MAAAERIADDLRAQAAVLGPGARLPSVRELARRHRASPVTVAAALAALSGEGVLVAQPGSGTFVASAAPGASEPGDLAWQAVALGPAVIDPGGLELLVAAGGGDTIALSSGFPEEALLPVRDLAAAAARAARRPGAWGRPAAEGIEELRRWFARDAGGRIEARDVLVTSGAQSALATVMRALGRRGDAVVVESPTYIGALAAVRGAGLVPVPVPVDGGGVRVELLEEAIARSRARLVLLQPTYANPHGAVLGEERRAAVLELAHAHGAFVIEDEWVRDLHLDGTPPPAPLVSRDRHGHVIYIRSLTKATAASLRIAGVCACGPAAERLRRARLLDDFFVSGMLQQAAVEFLTSPAWPRHLRRLRAALAGRRDALIATLAQELPAWRLFARPRGGLSLWLRLPDGADEARLVSAAAAEGVLVIPGAPWFPAEPDGPHVRMSFAAASEDRLREAVVRLARAARAVGAA